MNNNVFDSYAWSTLKKLNVQLQSLVNNTLQASRFSDVQEPWGSTFSMVFNDTISKPIYAAVKILNQNLDYYAPAASYEKDVLAFAAAVNEKVEHIQTFLDNGDRLVP